MGVSITVCFSWKIVMIVSPVWYPLGRTHLGGLSSQLTELTSTITEAAPLSGSFAHSGTGQGMRLVLPSPAAYAKFSETFYCGVRSFTQGGKMLTYSGLARDQLSHIPSQITPHPFPISAALEGKKC